MGQTSSSVKQRWNALHYAQVKVSIKPDLAVAFKDACTAADMSMAQVLSKYMADFCGLPTASHKSPMPDFSTRGKRRKAICSIIQQVESVRDAEEAYRDNIPTNLQASSVFDNADQCVLLLEEAIDSLSSAY